jgi:hypothetical protein
LYAGLPTDIQINIPLIIDAPFEVTTSREEIVDSQWNEIIRNELYNALIAMLHKMKEKEKNDIFRFVDKNGIFKDNPWLNVNEHYLRNRIADEELVLLLDGSYAAPNKKQLWHYQDICMYLFFAQMANVPKRNIIDSPRLLRILDILKWIGCEENSIQDAMELVREAVNNGHIADENFRDLVYSYLKVNSNTIYDDSFCRNMLIELPIVPAKSENKDGTIYISCNHKIYISPDICSSDEFFILDETVLGAENFNAIFHKDIQNMDDSQRGMLYWERIRNLLSNTTDKEQVATFMLNEFKTNKNMLASRKQELMGYKSQIPFVFADGLVYTGNAYIEVPEQAFEGAILNKMVVASEYKELAEFLGCEPITKIHYNDIDCMNDDYILDTKDVEDFLYGEFIYREEILRSFVADDKIPYELIARYRLERFIQNDDIDIDEYEFPTHEVKDIQKIHNKVLTTELNEITSQVVRKTARVPVFEFPQSEKREYVIEEYRPYNGNDVHFCQMCQTPKSQKYIEVRSIEYEPMFAWKQMQLCLCLEHSKDFDSLRREEGIMSEFIQEILDADIDDEPIIIPIGNKKIRFTATHLAYVQEILKRHKDIVNRQTKRK